MILKKILLTIITTSLAFLTSCSGMINGQSIEEFFKWPEETPNSQEGDSGTPEGEGGTTETPSEEHNDEEIHDHENEQPQDEEPPHVHSFSEVYSYDNEYHFFKCDSCDEVKDKEPHNFGEWIEDYPATELMEGRKERECTICHYIQAEAIDKLPHEHVPGDPVIENVVATSCNANGSYDEVTYCTVCGEELERITHTVDALEHTAGETKRENEVAATCTTDGSYDLVTRCSVCNSILNSEHHTIPAKGHTPGEAILENSKAATCTSDGSYDMVTYCTTCGDELNRETNTTAALGHKLKTVIEGKPSTCFEEGYSAKIICERCNKTIQESKTLQKLSHDDNGEKICSHCSYHLIYDKADFYSMNSGLSDNYALMNDIDLHLTSEEEGTRRVVGDYCQYKSHLEDPSIQENKVFKGIFDGGNHEITLGTLSIANYGVFGENRGTIRNFSVKPDGINLTRSEKVYVSLEDQRIYDRVIDETPLVIRGFACALNRGTIENVEIKTPTSTTFNLNHIHDHSMVANGDNMAGKSTMVFSTYFGYLCGYNKGTINNCKVDWNGMTVNIAITATVKYYGHNSGIFYPVSYFADSTYADMTLKYYQGTLVGYNDGLLANSISLIKFKSAMDGYIDLWGNAINHFGYGYLRLYPNIGTMCGNPDSNIQECQDEYRGQRTTTIHHDPDLGDTHQEGYINGEKVTLLD